MLQSGPAGVKTSFRTLSTDNCIWAKTPLHTVCCLAYVHGCTLLIEANANHGVCPYCSNGCSESTGMLVHAQAGLQSRYGTFNVSEYETCLVILQTPCVAGCWVSGNALNSECCQLGCATRGVTCGASAGPLGGPGWVRSLPGGACCWPQP